MAGVPDEQLTPSELAERYYDTARHVIDMWLRNKNVIESSCEEYRGDAMIALMHLAHEWKPEGGASFNTFLWKLLPLRTIDVARQRLPLRVANSEARLKAAQPLLMSADAEGNTDLLERIAPTAWLDTDIEDLDAFGNALGNLDSRMRLIVHLRMQGKTQAVIGEKLGVTEGRISQLMCEIEAVLRSAGFSC